MISSSTLLSYKRAQPFRPFRINMASGQSFEIRHPEMITLGKSFAMVFSFESAEPEFVSRWETISLMLAESVCHLDAVSSG